MDPTLIAQLALGLGGALLQAVQRFQDGQEILGRLVAENRGPTPEERATLRAASQEADERLDELLG